MIRIIDVTREEIPRVVPLAARFRSALKALKGIRSDPDEESGAEEMREFLDAGFPVFAAEKDGVLCGYIVCRVDKPCVWVEAIYVLPEYRRQGAASVLFEKAEEVASSFGEDTVYNYVHPNNEAMIAFLASKGYTVLNLVEIRRPYRGEKLREKIQVARNSFDY